MLSGILLSLVAVLVTIAVAFLVGRARHRYRDIDVFWPLGFIAVAVTGFVATGFATGFLAAVATLVILARRGFAPEIVHLGTWFAVGHHEATVNLVADALSVPYVCFSSGLCWLVNAFAGKYLHREPGFNRFFVLLALFGLWLGSAWMLYTVTLGPDLPVNAEAFARDVLTTREGWTMALVGTAIGFVFAVAALAIGVVSFPLLLDRPAGAGLHRRLLLGRRRVIDCQHQPIRLDA